MFGAKKRQESLGIEFSSDSIRLAYVRNVGAKKQVVELISKDLQGLTAQELAVFIRQQATRLKVKNPEVHYIVPSHSVITKNIEVPSLDPKEIEEIINLQASRHTPYGREEIIVDYVTVGVYKRSYTRILLVIVGRDTLRKHFAILKSIGLEPHRASFSGEALAKTISSMITIPEDKGPLCFLHIDTAFSEFNVLLKDRVIFIRSIPLGIQHLTLDREKQWVKLIDEIRQSLDVYRSEDIDTTPTRLLLTGLVDEIKDIVSVVNDSFRIPAESLSFLEHLSFSSQAQSQYAASKTISFLGAISAALSCDRVAIDLTPREIRLKRVFERKSKEVIKTAMLALFLLVMIVVFVGTQVYFKNTFLEKLNEKFKKVHKRAEALESDFSRIKIMKQYLDRRGNSIEALSYIYDALPDDIRILEIRFDNTGLVAIRGTAKSMTVIFALVDDLSKSSYFLDVETKYTTKRKEKDKDVADFEIAAVFAKEED